MFKVTKITLLEATIFDYLKRVTLIVELSNLKIRKTWKSFKKIFVILLKWLDENQAIEKRIISPYVGAALKYSMRMT